MVDSVPESIFYIFHNIFHHLQRDLLLAILLNTTVQLSPRGDGWTTLA